MSFKIDDKILIFGLILASLFIISTTPKRDKYGFILGENSTPINERSKVTLDPAFPGWHYWIRYDYFPINISDATVVTDTITIGKKIGNEIAPTNKIIYTFDIRTPHGGGVAFSAPSPGSDGSGGSMAEIMLTCESDKDYFNTAFQGYSAHIFKMTPTEGHIYERKFIVNLQSNPRTIKYYLTDLTTGQQENFVGTLTANTVIGDHLMATVHAVEYHDKFFKSGKPLMPRYDIRTSITRYK